MIKTCNLTVRFSIFTLNLKIYEKFVKFLSKLLVLKRNFIIVLGIIQSFFLFEVGFMYESHTLNSE